MSPLNGCYMPKALLAGSGIAGLFSAIKCADAGWDVCVITKQNLEESSTNYAQGGIAGILDKTNLEGKEIHIMDTLNAGDGYCNEDVVRTVVNEAGERINDLINVGVNFHTDSDGNFDFIKEGGHSQKIILHSKDSTGKEIENALLKRAKEHQRIKLLSNHIALDLIVDKDDSNNQEVLGLWVLNIDEGIVETFHSDSVILATGGGGQLFSRTTNPSVSTADGMAIASRAGAKLSDMEFVQFHPTSAAVNSKKTFLISEAVRGFGAVLMTSSEYQNWINVKQKSIENYEQTPSPDEFSFTNKYSQDGSLATRDVVARAIDNELNISGEDHVYLVTEHLDSEILRNRFPLIENFLNEFDLSLGKNPIPVVPAAHYFVGGVSVDKHGRVLKKSDDGVIKRLFAIGEVACTGMHGANRLASNSLLEAVVYSYRASSKMIKDIKPLEKTDSIENNINKWETNGLKNLIENYSLIDDLKSLKNTMTRDVGVVRSNFRLNRALRKVNLIDKEVNLVWKSSIPTMELIELRNMVHIALKIIQSALSRKNNLGLHYNTDNVKE